MDTLGTSTMIVSIFREATEGNIERRGPTLGANLIEVSFKWKIERPGQLWVTVLARQGRIYGVGAGVQPLAPTP